MNEPKMVRIPGDAHDRLMAFLDRLTLKPSQQSLIGAAVNYALDNERAFMACLATAKSAEEAAPDKA